MKTSIDKRVNRKIKKINKQIKEDVFGDRFNIRQYRKINRDGHYYQYELIDNKDNSRNIISYWISAFEILTFNKISFLINDFIITSDFWETYEK